MEDFYAIFHKPGQHDKEVDNRLLRKLRVALLFWFIALVVTAIWFTNSPAF